MKRKPLMFMQDMETYEKARRMDMLAWIVVGFSFGAATGMLYCLYALS